MAPVALRNLLFGDGPGFDGDHSIVRLEPATAGLSSLRKQLAVEETAIRASADGSDHPPQDGSELILLVDGSRWHPFDLAGLISAHAAGGAPLTVAVESAKAGGCIDMDRTGRITRLLAPLLRDPLAAWRPAGAAVIDRRMIGAPESGPDPFTGAPAAVWRSIWAGLLPEVVRRGQLVLGHPVERQLPVTAAELS